jgi:Ca-activated chloride channel family protein
LLSSAEKAKSIILITDGSDTAGSFVEEGLETATDYVAKNHIKVHTIGIGTGLANVGYLGETELRATHDKNSLQELSERTNGKYYEVKNTADIAAAFLDIEDSSEETFLSFDIGFILLTLSFLLLFVEWSLLNTRFRALP